MKRHFPNLLLVVTAMWSLTATPPFPAHGAATIPTTIATTTPTSVADTHLLIEALDTIRTRFTTSLIWTPGIGGPDNCALLTWMGV